MKALLVIFLAATANLAQAACPTEPVYPNASYPELTISTNLGDIVVELDRGRAPLTVNRFLHYVKSKTYDNNLVHRVEPEYVIQTGAFKTDFSDVKSCGNLVNESGNGLNNDRGTLAMARYDDPHSAGSSFFINLKDNNNLDPNKKSWGYTVFGYVVSGMEVIDLMVQGETAYNTQMDVPNAPVKPITIKSVRLNQ
ncbi:peptidylprolyl isomerase [Marinicella sp. S1101]|uniref:peptidylprolyl isomerase n=1 Tax=Marinicella marina TaxID=2996016 RepID=UPI002260E41E|nr:peptidylprolyl isomerase [Marinicella marina]MCX7552615.1 peptidylprolyl isomerase [Marinicella marina]MDJ1139491.1 peptidylprolyl isomerase [Marinicella marina]